MSSQGFHHLKVNSQRPQGLTIKRALHNLGFTEVTSVRAGKYMEVKIEGNDLGIAQQQADEMCRKLLANPVIENSRFEIEET